MAGYSPEQLKAMYASLPGPTAQEIANYYVNNPGGPGSKMKGRDSMGGTAPPIVSKAQQDFNDLLSNFGPTLAPSQGSSFDQFMNKAVPIGTIGMLSAATGGMASAALAGSAGGVGGAATAGSLGASFGTGGALTTLGSAAVGAASGAAGSTIGSALTGTPLTAGSFAKGAVTGAVGGGLTKLGVGANTSLVNAGWDPILANAAVKGGAGVISGGVNGIWNGQGFGRGAMQGGAQGLVSGLIQGSANSAYGKQLGNNIFGNSASGSALQGAAIGAIGGAASGAISGRGAASGAISGAASGAGNGLQNYNNNPNPSIPTNTLTPSSGSNSNMSEQDPSYYDPNANLTGYAPPDAGYGNFSAKDPQGYAPPDSGNFGGSLNYGSPQVDPIAGGYTGGGSANYGGPAGGGADYTGISDNGNVSGGNYGGSYNNDPSFGGSGNGGGGGSPWGQMGRAVTGLLGGNRGGGGGNGSGQWWQNLLGGAAPYAAHYFGSNQQNRQDRQSAAQFAGNAKFNPYGVNTAAGGASFKDGVGTATMSPDNQGLYNGLLTSANTNRQNMDASGNSSVGGYRGINQGLYDANGNATSAGSNLPQGNVNGGQYGDLMGQQGQNAQGLNSQAMGMAGGLGQNAQNQDFNDRFNNLQAMDRQGNNKFMSGNLDSQFANGTLASTAGQYQTQGALDSLNHQTMQNQNQAQNFALQDQGQRLNAFQGVAGAGQQYGNQFQGMGQNQYAQNNNQSGLGYNRAQDAFSRAMGMFQGGNQQANQNMGAYGNALNQDQNGLEQMNKNQNSLLGLGGEFGSRQSDANYHAYFPQYAANAVSTNGRFLSGIGNDLSNPVKP